MTIIKGTHGRIGGAQPATRGPRSVLLPNQSFRYLTFDPDSVTAQTLNEALLPASDPATVIDLLQSLGAAMIESSDTTADNSTIPPIYTYWGQYIDHDITAGTDRPGSEAMSRWTADILDTAFEPVAPQEVTGKEGIFNLREPFLNLDSLYGGGPNDPATIDEQIFLKDVPGSGAASTDPRLALGTISGSASTVPDAHLPNPQQRDLPRRDDRSPRIGDERNDENTIVAQFHTAFLRFHNAVVASLEAKHGRTPTFDEAAQLVRWHYQWLIVNDYLRTICMPQVVDDLLAADTHFFSQQGEVFMPLEFSVAAFRFGHSMVRASYDFNANFSNAAFTNLFTFTGQGGLGGFTQLPDIWVIDWRRFVDKAEGNRRRFARKIDTNLALPLTNLPSAGSGLVKHLAQRNLLRSYLLSVPTAQFVARQQGLPILPATALVPTDKPAVQAALEAEHGLLKDRTPLWYYILREAEVHADGNRLGGLGSHLVAGTLISLLKADPDSYLNHGWSPTAESAVVNPEGPILTIADLLQFAGVAAKIHKLYTPIIMR
ncbi:MAG TPA: heme peroxidase family protein [Caldilineaceae bacterium]|nr:heme peroxidase family protein [Caldilineaceae bacterium]